MCQIFGKLKIPNSPNSKVKKPKKFIFIEDKTNTVKGKIKDTKISTLLTLLCNNFCNSKSMSRNIMIGFVEVSCCPLVSRIALQGFLFVLLNEKVRCRYQT